MANHVLSLEAQDVMNKCVLRLVDTSVYLITPAPQCMQLDVLLPGFSVPTRITDLEQGFNLNLTACDLGIQSTNCGTSYLDLPDGIYVIRYSVSPNEYVYVEYNHLRMTCALNKYYEVLCELDLGACEPQDKIREKLVRLNIIKGYLDSAKAKVEICHEPSKGMDLYRYAVKQLDKMLCNSSSCSTC